ncbi:PAN domain-containing protein [Mycoplana dimorpha]|uniref:PAN domain-containing protein n=1 Tax=Mycoplana dimorpha TaxID=28320 RepID=A0A2T5BAW0_MYCDI|nr:PAN domain-containing protein [Mycoplana dimorpha]PTM96118.1 PAN domain-containing protein [Mycoplana dimorpha]
MRKTIRSAVMGVFATLLVAAAAERAFAEDQTFGPFVVDSTNPDLITLNGLIDAGSALNFRRALQAAPNAKLVTLNSPGGNVQMGLLIADDIHQRKLATYIPKESECYSACSFIFLAGKERKVDGELGVHQISSDSPDLVGAQLAISDIIEVLNRFDTPMDVMHVMFKTPPDDMHVFSQDEILRYGLNRSGDNPPKTPTVITVPAASGDTSATEVSKTTLPEAPTSGSTSSSSLEAGPSPQAKLSPIEEFTKRPNRIAIYTGLDLFGDDISSIRVDDAGACAKSCLLMDGQCKAFTFNTNPKIRKGPNCFLKASAGRADGNSVAFSGRFLSGAEPDPPTFTLGTIDPQSALFNDVDLPGGDLSRYPHRSARTPLDCRLACVDDRQCIAFTYIKAKKECWLKGAIGKPMFGKNMVSGFKTLESFSPAKILSLD